MNPTDRAPRRRSPVRQVRRWLAFRRRPQCTGQTDCQRYDHWTGGPHLGFTYDSWRAYPLRDETRGDMALWIPEEGKN